MVVFLEIRKMKLQSTFVIIYFCCFLFLQAYMLYGSCSIIIKMNYKTSSEKKQNGNWKKYPYLYNKHKNLDFKCSCGKNYTSFPALYLHCQRKHGKKISTQLVKDECMNAQNSKNENYLYCLKPEHVKENSEIIQATLTGEKIREVFDLFRKDSDQFRHMVSFRQTVSYQQKVASEFEVFLIKKYQSTEETNEIKDILYEIPYSFNEFFMIFQEECKSEGMKIICTQLLMYFGSWLKTQGYTDLMTIRQTSESQKSAI